MRERRALLFERRRLMITFFIARPMLLPYADLLAL